MINILDFLSTLNPEASTKITDKHLITSFVNDSDFPYLVSFPRTGSHWLRMLMELYFERPSLVRIFYFRHRKDFTCYHTHDEDLKVIGRTNILYLHRDPIDTVYSQLKYHKEDIYDAVKVKTVTKLYGQHLTKWLHEETFSNKKTIITYEGMEQDLIKEFRKVTAHFGANLDLDRFTAVAEQVTKISLKRKTNHDKQVVNLKSEYQHDREQFRTTMGDRIRDLVFDFDSRLAVCFR